MEHVHEISRNHEDIAEYEQNAHKIREERLSKIRQIESSIQDIASKQAGLTISLGQVTKEIDEETDAAKKEIKERRKQLIIEQIDRLELERRKLIKTKSTLSEEAESDLDTLDRELEKLEALWPKYTFEKRRSLINFVVKEVVIDTVSTHWVRVQVLWLHEAWGREEMYWYRTKGRNVQWTEQEIAIVREHYAAMPRLQLMALLPHRGWHAIRGLGIRLKIAEQPREGHRAARKS